MPGRSLFEETSGGLDLDIGKISDDDLHEGYKYLGIPQHMENKESMVMDKVSATYRKRLRQVLKSRINGGNRRK